MSAVSSAAPGTPTASSLDLRWQARVELALDPAQLEEFTTPATPDLTLVMVTAGRYTIASRHGRGWRDAEYGPGSVGTTAPGHRSGNTACHRPDTGNHTSRGRRHPSAPVVARVEDTVR